MSDLDLFTAAFAEYMTPEPDGTPVLLSGDLHHALEAVGIPKELCRQLEPLMDPARSGKIEFERFAEVCAANAGSGGKQEHVFQLLSENGEISEASLRRVADTLKLALSDADLAALVKIAKTRTEFADLWKTLNGE